MSRGCLLAVSSGDKSNFIRLGIEPTARWIKISDRCRFSDNRCRRESLISNHCRFRGSRGIGAASAARLDFGEGVAVTDSM